MILRLVLIIMFVFLGHFSNGKMKILFIPLDNRPSSLQFPVKIAEIGGVTLFSPPKDILGQFFITGDTEMIEKWILQQDIENFDAAIISIDMLVFGGLIGSREYFVDKKQSLSRLRIVEKIKQNAPHVKIYANSIIMRQALTYTDENTLFYTEFSEWAQILNRKDSSSRKRLTELEKKIPPEILDQYLLTRDRNLEVNLSAIELVKKGIIDFLILSQDDAHKEGIHISSRDRLQKEINDNNLESKISLQPGADEVSMLLLARAVNKENETRSTVKVIFCDEEKSTQIMPYEDRPLKETLDLHIRSIGAEQTESSKEADIFLYVFASRYDTLATSHFVKKIREGVGRGEKIILVDIDHTGVVQGGDHTLANKLMCSALLPKLIAYASWNTASNTVGTALSHGLICFLAQNEMNNKTKILQYNCCAQNWFMIHRLLDDYYYHNIIRRHLGRSFFQDGKSSRVMDQETCSKAEQAASKEITGCLSHISSVFFENNCRITELLFEFPWKRGFEAHIDFDVICLE